MVLPYGNLALAKIHHAATAWVDVVETMHQGLAVAALVEVFRNLAIRIVDRFPRGCLAKNLLGDEDPRRRAVAYAPRVKAGGNVEIWRLRGRSDKREAIGTIIILVDPPPGGIANLQISPRPSFELAEMLGHIALQSLCRILRPGRPTATRRRRVPF